jgi:hypothetical protein
MGGMQLRTAALVGVLGLGLGWALASRVQPGRTGDPLEGRGSTGPRPLGVPPTVNLAPLAEQLRLRLDQQQPRAPRPARNPFVFGSGRAPAASPARSAVTPAEPTAMVEPQPDAVRPGAAFRLTGMATTHGPEGPELTAMVHDGQSLVFVKWGDVLAGGFEVVDIQETAVTLRDSAGGERTLRLR